MLRHVYLLAAIAAFIAAPAPVYANDRPVVVYPYIYNYPGQQLCQVDRHDRRYSELCAAQSYHPYGLSGYRPYGTYRPYRGEHGYWVAPDARVIKINPQDQ